VIREDRLGLDVIYLQPSGGQNRAVRRPDMHAFTGALQGFHADKGVFITISRFTDDARTYAAGIQTRVVLIDGAELAELMIDHGVGVSIARSYELRRLDEDYFDADRGGSVRGRRHRIGDTFLTQKQPETGRSAANRRPLTRLESGFGRTIRDQP
jgi:Restriction endonuclease